MLWGIYAEKPFFCIVKKNILFDTTHDPPPHARAVMSTDALDQRSRQLRLKVISPPGW